MRPYPISAFIISLNEEAYIGACIESLEACAEIVIVDSGSQDRTADIVAGYAARGFPIRFMHQDWLGYAGQKQFALEQCTQDWCLNIDADERLDKDLRDGLADLVATTDDVVGWRIARRPYLIGHGYTRPAIHERRNLRLIRRGKGAYDLRQAVHEGIVPAPGRVSDSMTGSLLHYRPLVMDEQIGKENRYSTLKADQIVRASGKRSPWRMLFSPVAYFTRLYLWNGLWRCGFPGFIQAATGGVYSFLTEAKVYQRNQLARRPNRDDWSAE